MNPRLAAGALLAAAAAAYFGLAVPFRTRAEAARAEFQQVRDQRRQSRARLGTLERREAARQRAAALLAAAAASPGSDASGIVRRAVVTSLEAVRVSPVKLTVRPARAPVGASLSLSAEGRFAEVVRLAGHLVRPGSGLILERVQMLSRPAGLLLLDLQAIGALQAAR